MDQVEVFYVLILEKIVAPVGAQNFVIRKQGKEKLRATVIFLIAYSIDFTVLQKAKPFIIFKGIPI